MSGKSILNTLTALAALGFAVLAFAATAPAVAPIPSLSSPLADR